MANGKKNLGLAIFVVLGLYLLFTIVKPGTFPYLSTSSTPVTIIDNTHEHLREELLALISAKDSQFSSAKASIEALERKNVDLQKVVDVMQQAHQNSEATNHVALQDLAKQLRQLPQRAPVAILTKPSVQLPVDLPQPSPQSSIRHPRGIAEVSRRDAVKAAMKHAWDAYTKFAWGQDDLDALSSRGVDWLHQSGTIIDSLDVLWVMDMKPEFQKARDHVATVNFDHAGSVSFFETVIRQLGGLLSAYGLSKDKIFLDKAILLGDKLVNAFDTPTGIPVPQISLAYPTGSSSGGSICLAEAGTVQMEFVALSRFSGNPKYATAALKGFKAIVDAPHAGPKGLPPDTISIGSATFLSSKVSMGGGQDSYFEYLLKVWLVNGRQSQDQWIRDAQTTAFNDILTFMIKDAGPNGQYIPDLNGDGSGWSHLACFSGAMFMLGSTYAAPEDKLRYLSAGTKITETCMKMASSTVSGLAPESVSINNEDIQVRDRYNILRPEIIESVFYMWRYTHDQKYRDKGWAMFQAFENHCRVASGGYAGVSDVSSTNPSKSGKMESFWIAETLKYFFLLFSDDSVLPLDQYVFTTEAHPIPLP